MELKGNKFSGREVDAIKLSLSRQYGEPLNQPVQGIEQRWALSTKDCVSNLTLWVYKNFNLSTE